MLILHLLKYRGKLRDVGMGDKGSSAGLNDLLELFTDNLELSDITASRILGNISAAITKRRLKYHMTQKAFAEFL